MRKDKNTEAFLALVKAGLWESVGVNPNANNNLYPADEVDWYKVYQLAQEQSVIGVVLAGIERLKSANLNLNVPQDLLLQWIGEVQMLEQQNKAMNLFVAELIEKMRNDDIYTLLVKGQGIAQCYERPLWRTSGDVDLYLSDTNYKRAQDFLTPLAQSVEPELHGEKHIAMHINNWVVELHGAMPTRLISRIDKVLEKIQNNLFTGGEVRAWQNGQTIVFLPSPDNDVLIVFTHILKHFFRGGIGLRQICDWCRLLWTYKDSLNYRLLESRIKEMGLMTEWRAFGALAIECLGMPKGSMPFLNVNDDLNARSAMPLGLSKNLKKKADRIMEFLMETGNFGYNRDTSYFQKRPYVVRKAISLRQHTLDGIHHFKVFPLDSLRIWCRILRAGFKAVIERR